MILYSSLFDAMSRLKHIWVYLDAEVFIPPPSILLGLWLLSADRSFSHNIHLYGYIDSTYMLREREEV